MTPKELSEKLWGSVARVTKYLLPDGRREGHEWVVGSVNGEAGKSLKINLSGKKVWSDFAEGTGGDLLDLWVQVRDCGLHQAMTEAKQFLGITDDDHHFVAKQKKNFVRPDRNRLTKHVFKPNVCYAYLESRGITRQTVEAFEI
ncbi:hypothetical protein [Xenorhabdus littoralis]|uniref:hypothetical protein n=1 Tax=Xenorhabdus littoralis TaxID=2582835 RepID=UPI0029E80D23|nr:hypothetical protein [Xenorhabdus sp. psl]